jgi:hypothetical protein
MRPAGDWPYEFWYQRWDVASIAIEEHYDFTIRRDRTSAGSARSPVATRRSYDSRAGLTRPLCRSIGATVINDNYFDEHAGRETFANYAGDWVLLV